MKRRQKSEFIEACKILLERVTLFSLRTINNSLKRLYILGNFVGKNNYLKSQKFWKKLRKTCIVFFNFNVTATNENSFIADEALR